MKLQLLYHDTLLYVILKVFVLNLVVQLSLCSLGTVQEHNKNYITETDTSVLAVKTHVVLTLYTVSSQFSVSLLKVFVVAFLKFVSLKSLHVTISKFSVWFQRQPVFDSFTFRSKYEGFSDFRFNDQSTCSFSFICYAYLEKKYSEPLTYEMVN